MQKGHPSFLCWMLMEWGKHGKDDNHWKLQMWFWRDKWILIKYQDVFSLFFSSYCSTQNDLLGAIPNPAEDCHQFSRLKMTLSELLYSLQKNAGSKNTFWHLGEVMSISSHTQMQLLESICPFHFSRTNWCPECSRKRLRLSSSSAC